MKYALRKSPRNSPLTTLFAFHKTAASSLQVHLNAKELRLASGSRGTSSIPRRKMESQVLKTGSLLTALWITSWTPYVIVLLIAMLRGEEFLSPLIVTLPSIFCKASACFNPYIYGLCLPAFRDTDLWLTINKQCDMPTGIRLNWQTDEISNKELNVPSAGSRIVEMT
ncbi:ocellar opsin-like [Penaeus monodon]|uniref:ocellar opsin-like n=1 Tax=Penaeus monodon TaxID=6687 RepID=UPI0018A74E13|nr:ocellar opsin-like [Penaeus monodon]